MNLYTNRFTVSVNHDRSEVSITFMQEIPAVPLNPSNGSNQPAPTAITPVAALVMNGDCAQNLVDILSKLLSETDAE